MVKRLLAEGKTRDEIVAIVARTYDVSEWTAREIVAHELGRGDVVGGPTEPPRETIPPRTAGSRR